MPLTRTYIGASVNGKTEYTFKGVCHGSITKGLAQAGAKNKRVTIAVINGRKLEAELSLQAAKRLIRNLQEAVNLIENEEHHRYVYSERF